MEPPKYPKTFHIEGSKGVVEDDQVALGDLEHVVVEEKLDGSEVSLFFESPCNLSVWHRNNPATGEEFGKLKEWAYTNYGQLEELLGSRYVLFGEWLFAKHTVFYDQLPSYLFAYDVWDSEEGVWFSTSKRREFLSDLDIEHVPVVYEGKASEIEDLENLMKIRMLDFRSDNVTNTFIDHVESIGLDVETVLDETELGYLPEGLYIKEETETETVGWFKYIRPEFIETILGSGSHWKDRPLISNLLKE